MKESFIDIINIRRMVFAEIAKRAYEDIPLNTLDDAVYKLIPGEEATYRDSIFKERAVLGERLRLALGLDVRNAAEMGSVHDGIDKVDLDYRVYGPPLVNVIPFACEACPTKSIRITGYCRKCLAHPCKNECPAGAIIMEEKGAIIDQDKCIKCGRCIMGCPYSAIIQYERPCAASCGVKAINSDSHNRATIDYDKCVSCGHCIQKCPFGAISDKSEIYQLIKAITSDQEIYAIIAPSFVGQFGALTQPSQIIEAIKMLGIKKVVEVSLGADMTTINEAKEFTDEVPEKQPFLGTSCCYSWNSMVKKLFPELHHYISDSSTPMIYTAQYVKKDNPNAKVVFIGPCISKKLEALEDKVSSYVDFVITYEELIGMFVAKHIEPSEMKVDGSIDDASITGRGYAIAGGVANAVEKAIKEIAPEKEITIESAQGLAECVKLMKMAKSGKKDGYLLEGMACDGGCIGGPGTLAALNRTRKEVTKFSSTSKYKSPLQNDKLNINEK